VAVGELALRLRLVAAHADLRTIALVDVDGKRELGPLAAGLTQSVRLSAAEGVADRSGPDGGATGNQHWTAGAEPAPGGPGPGLLVKPRGSVTGNATVHIYPLGQMKWVAGTTHVGIVVLSGPVARVSRITALHDLSASSGWPIAGIISIPRQRRWWRTRRPVSVTEPASGAIYPTEHEAEGPGR